MSFEVISHLVNKTSGNKGKDMVINYMNTNPLFMHKPKIDRNPINEPSIRSYYNIKTVDNGVDPTAFAQFTRDKYHSQDLQFKNYSKKTLINDLESGHNNYANDYLIFNRAYLNNNDGKPLIRNNTMLAGLYMNENNTPKNIPFTPEPGGAGGPDPSGGAPSGGGPSGGAPSGAGAPDPSGGGPSGGAPSGAGAPDPPKVDEDNERINEYAKKMQRLSKSSLARKQFKEGQEKMVDEDGTITFKGGKLKEKLIVERMAEVRKKYPDYKGTDEELRDAVLMDMKKSYGRVKYQQTGDVKEPYTNDGVTKRKQNIAKLKDIKQRIAVRKVAPRLKAKLEGIRAVKASSSAQPVDPQEYTNPSEKMIDDLETKLKGMTEFEKIKFTNVGTGKLETIQEKYNILTEILDVHKPTFAEFKKRCMRGEGIKGIASLRDALNYFRGKKK